MLMAEGRLLPTPVVKYGAGTEKMGPESGSWNLRGKRLISPRSFRSYGIVYLPTGRGIPDEVLQSFARALADSLAGLGLGAPGPPVFMHGNPLGDLGLVIEALFAKTGSHFQRKPELFLFLVHQDCTPAIYKVIKNCCERKYGVASQVKNAAIMYSLQQADLVTLGHGR